MEALLCGCFFFFLDFLQWVCDYIFTKSIIFKEMWQLSLSIRRNQMNKASNWESDVTVHIPLHSLRKVP